MEYRVSTFRSAGLQAHWGRTRTGAPIIVARQPGGRWFRVDKKMWDTMQERGVLEGFREWTFLADIFPLSE